jgi:ADP-ribose pyrophosphatase YjhB (NUDIX family)
MLARDVALIALYNEKKEILLQIRTKDDRIPREHLGFFGGGVEQGEQPEGAVRREALEELDYNLRSPELILTQDFRGRNMGYDGLQYVFAEKYDQSQPLSQREGLGKRWYGRDNIDESLISDRDKEALPAIFNYLDSIK